MRHCKELAVVSPYGWSPVVTCGALCKLMWNVLHNGVGAVEIMPKSRGQ